MALKDYFIKFTRSLDFIGIKPGLFINGSKRYQTLTGGILCILIYCAMLLALLYFSQDLVYLTNPSETRSVEYSYNPEPILIGPGSSTFNFTVSITTEDNIPINRNYFVLKFYEETVVYCGLLPNISESDASDLNLISLIEAATSMCSITNLNKYLNISTKEFETYKNIREIKVSNCNSTKFYNMDTSGSYCVSELDNITLLGNKYSFLSQTFRIALQPCLLGTCPSPWSDVWQNLKLILYYENSVYNTKKYSDPVYLYPVQIDSKYVSGKKQRTSIFLKNLEIQTDIGYILEDFRSRKIISFSEFSSSIEEPNLKDQNPTLIELQFEISPIKEIVYRKYIKVQRILAELGGLYKAFTVLALILNHIHNRSEYYETLFNDLFVIEDMQKYFHHYDPDVKRRNSITLENMKRENHFKKLDSRNPDIESVHNLGMLKKETREDNSRHPKAEVDIREQRVSQAVTEFLHKLDDKDKKENLIESATSKQGECIINRVSNQKVDESVCNERKISKQKKDVNSSDEDDKLNKSKIQYLKSLRRNTKYKDTFNRLRKEKYNLSPWEYFQFTFCKKNVDKVGKRNMLLGGKEMIKDRTDMVHIMKKMLEFDRFKNLMLRDEQLVLLESISKFMLDPETLKLLDINNLSYEKFIENYTKVSSSDSNVDIVLSKWVQKKFQLNN